MKRFFSKAVPLAVLSQVRELGRRLRGHPKRAEPPVRARNRSTRGVPAATSLPFAAGSAVVRREHLRLLARIADYFLRSPYRAIVLQGHASESESPGHAAALATRRSRAVRNWLRRFGVDPEDMTTVAEATGADSSTGPPLDQRKVTIRFLPQAPPARSQQRPSGAQGANDGEAMGGDARAGADPRTGER